MQGEHKIIILDEVIPPIGLAIFHSEVYTVVQKARLDLKRISYFLYDFDHAMYFTLLLLQLE
jgi:hypothetical protein